MKTGQAFLDIQYLKLLPELPASLEPLLVSLFITVLGISPPVEWTCVMSKGCPYYIFYLVYNKNGQHILDFFQFSHAILVIQL